MLGYVLTTGDGIAAGCRILCSLSKPYQAKCNTAQLNYICVGHRVEAAHPGVEHGYKGRDDYGRVKGDHEDDGKSGSCQWWSQTVSQSVRQ